MPDPPTLARSLQRERDYRGGPVFAEWEGEPDMALQMKRACEKCSRELTWDADAAICSYECTFCPECSERMDATCPNCRGELVRRPKRKPPVSIV